MRFEVLTAVTMKITVFCAMMSHSWL